MIVVAVVLVVVIVIVIVIVRSDLALNPMFPAPSTWPRPQSDRMGKKAFGALLALHHMPTVLVQMEETTLMKSTLVK